MNKNLAQIHQESSLSNVYFALLSSTAATALSNLIPIVALTQSVWHHN